MEKEEIVKLLAQCLPVLQALSVSGDDKRKLVAVEDAMVHVIRECAPKQPQANVNGAAANTE